MRKFYQKEANSNNNFSLSIPIIGCSYNSPSDLQNIIDLLSYVSIELTKEEIAMPGKTLEKSIYKNKRH